MPELARLPRALLMAACVALAGCAPAVTAPPSVRGPDASPAPASALPDASSAPAASASPGSSGSGGPATLVPDASPSPLQSPPPVLSPSPEGSASPEPSPSPDQTPTNRPPRPSASPGSASACSGTADNRDFFASLADSVAWDVYCGVVPPHWTVLTGDYHLASGGRLEITYKGPSGARLTLHEGAFCGVDAACPPPGTDTAAATFGSMGARLYLGTDGTPRIFVQHGPLAWEAVGTAMDQRTLADLTGSLALVGP